MIQQFIMYFAIYYNKNSPKIYTQYPGYCCQQHKVKKKKKLTKNNIDSNYK